MKQVYYAVNFVIRPSTHGYELLLVRRTQGRYMGGTWQLVSGKIQSDETALEAGLREIREETGIKPIEYYRIPEVSQFYRHEDNSINTMVSFLAITTHDVQVRLNKEHTDSQWVTLDQAIEMLIWPVDRSALESARRMILNNSAVKPHLRIF